MKWFWQKEEAVVKAGNKNLDKAIRYLASHDLSTIPSILGKIMAIGRDPKAGAEEFAQVYQMDKTSTARLLRTANSVYYTTSSQQVVQSIQEAIVRVGFQKAQDIVNSAVVCNLFKMHENIEDYSSPELWKHSMAVALGVQLIYEFVLRGERPGVDPYLAGLLHDIGISIEHAALYKDGFQQAVADRFHKGTRLAEEEVRCLGLSHEMLGWEMAQRWRFPEPLQTVIACHHSFESAEPPFASLVHAVRVSEWLCFEAQLGYSDISQQEEASYLTSFQQLRMDLANYEKLKTRLAAEVQKNNALGWFSPVRLKMNESR